LDPLKKGKKKVKKVSNPKVSPQSNSQKTGLKNHFWNAWKPLIIWLEIRRSRKLHYGYIKNLERALKKNNSKKFEKLSSVTTYARVYFVKNLRMPTS